MRWQGRRKSRNVEDRRGMRVGKKSFGIGGLVIAAIMAYVANDPSIFFNSVSQQVSQTVSTPSRQTGADNEVADFSKVVLGNLEDTWTGIFKQTNIPYQNPTLVLYSNKVQSACGTLGGTRGFCFCLCDCSRIWTSYFQCYRYVTKG